MSIFRTITSTSLTSGFVFAFVTACGGSVPLGQNDSPAVLNDAGHAPSAGGTSGTGGSGATGGGATGGGTTTGDTTTGAEVVFDSFSELVGTAWNVPAGDEATLCKRKTLSTGLDITRLRVNAPDVTRFVSLYAGAPSGPDGVADCSTTSPTSGALLGAASGFIEVALKDGTAIHLDAGTQLVLRVHQANTTGVPLIGTTTVYASLAAEGSDPVAVGAPPADTEECPAGPSTDAGACPAPPWNDLLESLPVSRPEPIPAADNPNGGAGWISATTPLSYGAVRLVGRLPPDASIVVSIPGDDPADFTCCPTAIVPPGTVFFVDSLPGHTGPHWYNAMRVDLPPADGAIWDIKLQTY